MNWQKHGWIVLKVFLVGGIGGVLNWAMVHFDLPPEAVIVINSILIGLGYQAPAPTGKPLLPPRAGALFFALAAPSALLCGCQSGNWGIYPGGATFNDGRTRATLGAIGNADGSGTAFLEVESLDRTTSPTIRVSQPNPWTVRGEADWRPLVSKRIQKALIPEK